jgi:hypothetical protein
MTANLSRHTGISPIESNMCVVVTHWAFSLKIDANSTVSLGRFLTTSYPFIIFYEYCVYGYFVIINELEN